MTPRFSVVLVTDTSLCDAGATVGRLRVMPLDSRVAVEVREKAMATREVVRFCQEVRDAVRPRGAAFIVNDRIDVAVSLDADGVQLPANGLPTSEVRALVGGNRLIGRSIHGARDVSSDADADFLRFGPLFASPSKARFGEPQGLDRLRDVVVAAGSRPIFAVGGIRLDRIRAVQSAGARGVAVIRDWLLADDPVRWLDSALSRLSDRA